MKGQLGIFDPPAEGWWEYSDGPSTVWIVADRPEDARESAQAQLRDLGVIPGGPPGLHDSYERMRKFAARG